MNKADAIAENFFVQRADRKRTISSLFSRDDLRDVSSFFRGCPGYEVTPLHRLTGLARRLGIADIYVKDESRRFGTNSFKMLGVMYAVSRMVRQGLIPPGSTLVCATDGNHGRAVARVARMHGLKSYVYVHEKTVMARIESIRGEGAEVVTVAGNYEQALAEAVRAAGRHGWTLLADTSWVGYELVPRFIAAGYAMLMEEAAQQWPSGLPPTILLVQVGVGSLLGAVVSWYGHNGNVNIPSFLACEPRAAACLLESMRTGRLVSLEGSLETMMAGLSCGTVSLQAWPLLSQAVDACVAIEDVNAAAGMRTLFRPCDGDPVVIAGESGACGLASLLALLHNDEFRTVREACDFSASSRILVINTEGATDPENYARIVGTEVV
jgi:diaminopropionate ammonia-lyase